MTNFELRRASSPSRMRPAEALPSGVDGRRPRPVPALVLEIVKGVDESLLQPIASADAGIAFQPRILLAMITYCYACRICGSQEVEAMMQEDSAFRILCNNEFPDWNAIRRFRRHNRDALQHCLAHILQRLEFPTSSLPQNETRSEIPLSLGQDRHCGTGDSPHEQQALALIELAILLDSVAYDA